MTIRERPNVICTAKDRERENETIGILMNDSTLFLEMNLPGDGSFPSIDF